MPGNIEVASVNKAVRLEGRTQRSHCHIRTGRPTYIAVCEETDWQGYKKM
jgi:hypothetical protein